MSNHPMTWRPVCTLGDILPDTGICALVGGRQVAIFYVADAEERLYAIGNVDPNAGAGVLSRGLVGNLGKRLVVASPLYKHHFDLRSGECLEAPQNSVPTYPVRVENDVVMVGL